MHRGNSWNYVFICYNLGDVDKYKFVSAILEFNMAAITATSNGSYGIPWPLKRGVNNKQNVSTCLSFGVIAENRSKMAAILNFKMAATRGCEYVGGISFPAPLGWVYPYVKSFMLASKTERFWWICGICRSTNSTGACMARMLSEQYR